MSNTYVKKYDVGQIKLDLPYANYIHELPLLSFGDVQHTINLNLIFNYQRKVENNNPFHIAPGFQLNLQKKVNDSDGSISFQDANGKIMKLVSSGGAFTFPDDSQRILRRTLVQEQNTPTIPNTDITMESGITKYEYTIEYPDFSKESYDSSGRIVAVYDKYSDDNALFTYTYEYGKLSAITYNGKTIGFSYTSDNLSSITYGGKTINIQFDDNDDCLTITHQDSLVKYELTVSTYSYTAEGSSTEESGEVKYSQELQLSDDGKTIVISDKIGNETINTVIYTFPNNWYDELNTFNQVEVTDNNGVKTRIQYEGDKPLYSYEIQGDDAKFINGQFAGNINLHNTVGTPTDNKTRGVQTINDGMLLGDSDGNNQWSIGVRNNKFGYYTLSGWLKTDNTNITGASVMVGASTSYLSSFGVSLNKDKWTYFSCMFYVNSTDSEIVIVAPQSSSISMCDFRLTHQGADESHLNMSKCVLLNNNDEVSFNDDDFCCNRNGVDINVSGVTFADLMKYKINKRRTPYNNEIYYNNCRGLFSNAQNLRVVYNDDLVNIDNFDLGIVTYSNKKKYITRICIDENNPNGNIIKTISVGGTVISKEVLDNNLDVISSVSDGATTNYERNAQGLVTKEETLGLHIYKTVYGDNEITVSEVREVADDESDELIEQTLSKKKYYLNPVWGYVYKVELLDSNDNVMSVVENMYDSESTLTGVTFGGNSPRNNTLSYSKGYLSEFANGNLRYKMFYDSGYLTAIKKYVPNSTEDDPFRIIEQHTHTKENDKTTIDSQYPSAENSLYSTTTVFDKYGRLESVEDTLENVYCLDSYCYYLEYENGTNIPKTEIENYNRSTHGELVFGSVTLNCKDSVLSQRTDKMTNEVVKYGYDGDNLVAAVTYDSSNNVTKQEIFIHDDIQRLTKDKFLYNTMSQQSVESNIEYATNVDSHVPDNRVSKYTYKVNGVEKAQTLNSFESIHKRVQKKEHTVGGKSFSKQMFYNQNELNATVDKCGNTHLATTYYNHDAMGRITSVAVSGNTASYTYDAYGQLVGENNQGLDKTFQYVYNGIGNIESVTSSGNTINFGYTDTAHPDRLTSYNGKAITYNANGGVASYDGWNYNWNNRGKLASITTKSNARALKPILSSSKTYSFTYNALGQRTTSNYTYFWVDNGLTPIVQGEVTNYSKTFYYDHSGRLISETISKTLHGVGNESESIVFLYDESSIIGMVRTASGVTNAYYFQRNLLGDVIAIYDTNGTKIVEYAYDAWGNCTIKGTTTNYVVAHANPIRYRGYYYDEDTKLYYLNSRYYSPEFRRFISPDDTSYLDPENVNGLNLYCYCNNDPINFVDPSGHSVIIISAIIGAIIGGVYGGITAAANGQNVFGGIAIGAFSGFIMGLGSATASLFIAPAIFGQTAVIGSLTYSAGAALAIGTGIAFGSGAVGGAIGDAFTQLVNDGAIHNWESVAWSGLQWGLINTASAILGSLGGPKTSDLESELLSAIFGSELSAIGLTIDTLRNKKSQKMSTVYANTYAYSY